MSAVLQGERMLRSTAQKKVSGVYILHHKQLASISNKSEVIFFLYWLYSFWIACTKMVIDTLI
jgi:hypothetical protein